MKAIELVELVLADMARHPHECQNRNGRLACLAYSLKQTHLSLVETTEVKTIGDFFNDIFGEETHIKILGMQLPPAYTLHAMLIATATAIIAAVQCEADFSMAETQAKLESAMAERDLKETQ